MSTLVTPIPATALEVTSSSSLRPQGKFESTETPTTPSLGVETFDTEEKKNVSFLKRVWQGPYVRVVIYAIACLTTSCVYFGWQPYSEMIFRQGAYKWLCNSPTWDFDIDGPCVEMDKAVTRLYSFAQGSEFVCAFVAGLLLDHLGPRYTALAGELLFGLSVLMICVSRKSFQLYIPAMIISGGCVNIVAFPSLVVTEAWPTRQALAVSIIVGAQSGASIIAPILKSIWDANPDSYSYFGIWGVYLLVIWLPVTLLYLLALPARRNYSQLVKKASDSSALVMRPEVGLDDEDLESGVVTPQGEDLEPLAGRHLDMISVKNNGNSNSISSTSLNGGPVNGGGARNGGGGSVGGGSVGGGSVGSVNGGSVGSVNGGKSSRSVGIMMMDSKAKWSAFLRDIKTIDLIIAAIFMFLLMLQFAYYPSVVRDAISEKISGYIGWMTPLQAPFSVVIGFIMDYTGTCLVMYAMSISLIFVSLSAGLGPHNLILQRIVGLLFVFMQSATYNLKYTFVNEMYDPYNFGKLVGFLGIMGGIGVYVNAPIASSTNYKTIFLTYVAVAVIMAGLTTFLYIREKKGITHKTVAGVQQKHRRNKNKNKQQQNAQQTHTQTAVQEYNIDIYDAE